MSRILDEAAFVKRLAAPVSKRFHQQRLVVAKEGRAARLATCWPETACRWASKGSANLSHHGPGGFAGEGILRF